jgi:hypothetical protein
VSPQAADFRIIGPLRDVMTIARGRGVQIRALLRKMHGGTHWRKMKGVALIEDDNGWIGDAEIHWFEAHGVGRVKWKIKRKFFDS